jgi:fermentation-respiration switch protein FrsA (DUF1100 family)
MKNSKIGDKHRMSAPAPHAMPQLALQEVAKTMIRLLPICLLLALAGPATAAPDFSRGASQPPPPLGIGARSYMVLEPFGPERAVEGQIVEGMGAGPHPAVLFVHWLGDPATTNRLEFELEAYELARRGVTSLLVDAPWSKPGWFDPLGASADADIRASEDEVVDLRRSLDLLLSRPDIDRSRVAYVGHDFGAMFGLLLASVDARPSYYVFMTPNSSLGEWYLWGKKVPDRVAYLARLAMFDLPGFARQLKAKGVLFQFSTHDTYVTREHAEAIAGAAPEPKIVQWINADHSLEGGGARVARLKWLEDELGLPH